MFIFITNHAEFVSLLLYKRTSFGGDTSYNGTMESRPVERAKIDFGNFSAPAA